MSSGDLTALVTGANAGLGFETCKQLALADGSNSVTMIVLACRSEAKAKAAITELVKQTGVDAFHFSYVVMVSKLPSKSTDYLFLSLSLILNHLF
jgi:NAD(P)-dependent dehydrogenase (short-subunit alcohol dehydrogenase family)